MNCWWKVPAVFCIALSGCRAHLPSHPAIDVCVVLTSGNAHCLPFKHEGPEYLIQQSELPGGFWISPDHFAKIQLYIKDLEALLEK